MQIESIDLSKEVYESMGAGFPTLPMDKPLRMRDLGQCVVIAGKNGSGKTRLLEMLTQVTNRFLSLEERRQAEFQIAQFEDALKTYRGTIERVEKEGPRNGDPPGLVEETQKKISGIEQEIEKLENSVALSKVLVVRGSGRPKVVKFVPRSTDLSDPTSVTEQEAIQRARSFASALAADGANMGAPAYARDVMRAALRERCGRMPTNGTEWQDAEAELHRLLASLIGEDIKVELNEHLNLCLEGLPDRYDTLLSDGQKVLFQLACMLHARHASLKDCIIFLDEPENHLHPSALNDLVDRLLSLLSEGQLWIATHSVPLIAHLVANDPNCLWFADGGRFKPAGRTPETVLDSLLGGPDGARRLNELTLLPSRFASSVFLRQCLLPPSVVGYNDKDPQLQQIREVLDKLRVDGQPLRVVDFGSGKGRLLAEISRDIADQPLSAYIDYIAYEPHRPDAEQCQRQCSSLYGEADVIQRAFSNYGRLREARGERFADVAVVCNVLHEVRPDQWLSEFGGGSQLARLLKEDGYVLFVEDYALPVGERAHEYGFLLLDQDQLGVLFGISEEDVAQGRFTRSDHATPKFRGRLIAHLVSARCLQRLSKVSTRNAVHSLQEQSLTRLRALLVREHDARSASECGRESALVTQLVANCASLSGILCARHNMTVRSMHAKQRTEPHEAEERGDRRQERGVAQDPEGTARPDRG